MYIYTHTVDDSPIINGLAVVILRNLNCDTVYTIKAAGTLDDYHRTLVGPFANLTSLVSGPCSAVVLQEGKIKDCHKSFHKTGHFMQHQKFALL